jgi:prepilin-type N-terminal cleavage/methylation domain-containing protein
MTTLKRDNTQHAFSLIELLIVIVVISLIYALGFSSFSIKKDKPKALTPLNLKENILHSKNFNDQATFMCVNKCRKCYLRQGLSSSFQPYTNKIDLKNIKAYTLDERESLKQIEYERFNDEKICLVIDFYNNGSSTQIILEDDEGAYFLPAFFGEAKKFDSPSDAKEYWLEQSDVVSDSGAFY